VFLKIQVVGVVEVALYCKGRGLEMAALSGVTCRWTSLWTPKLIFTTWLAGLALCSAG